MKKLPNKTQAEVLEAAGLTAHEWYVVKELPNSIIFRHRFSNEYKSIEKEVVAECHIRN